MKYFDLSIAAYQGKTAHLSLAEHGAYMLMMMNFYSTEKPLPSDRRVLYRLLRAESSAERKAIDAVAEQFWVESKGKLTNPRCNETLDKYLEWVSKQKANGSLGGRPRETHGKPNANQSLSDGKPIANQSLTHGKANGSHDLESYSENKLRESTPTSDFESDAGASAPRGRVGGKKRFRTADEIEAEEIENAKREGRSASL